MSELYCTLCERLVVVDDMKLARDFREHGKASRATYLSNDGLAHVVLNLEASKKFKPKVIVVPKAIVQTKPVVKIEGEDDVDQTGA